MKYQAIFFDMDGTVSDTLKDITETVNHTMRHFGLRTYAPEEVKPLLGNGARYLLSSLLPEGPPGPDELLSIYLPYYAAHAGDDSPPYDGILPMLKELKARGIPTAIISNKPDSAVQPVAAKCFSGLIDLAVGEKEGIRRKPAPDMLIAAADSIGVELGSCLYVGDSEVDIDTARNAGIDCVSVSWGFRSREQLIQAGASVIIDRPEELSALLWQQ